MSADRSDAVTTTSGTLLGRDLGDVLRFAGIRYAEAPVGDLRFRPPVAHRHRSDRSGGVVDATEFGPIAHQPPSPIDTMVSGAVVQTQDEDCLRLNIWTPSTSGRRPVLVWIHGGGFMTGSGSSGLYDGAALSRRGDVVIVTINYRLGPLGFLELGALDPELRGSGNNGIRDQLAALDWVQQNIAGFGGDPDNVTIFGESAGAMSVTTLVAASGGGSFGRAIAQSGAGHNAVDLAGADSTAAAILELAGSGGGSGGGELARIDPAALVAAAEAHRNGLRNVLDRVSSAAEVGPLGMALQPVIDGDLLSAAPIDMIRAGAGGDVDLLVGTNADEWNLFDPSRRPLPADRLWARLGRLGVDIDALAEAYDLTVLDTPEGEQIPRRVQSEVMTDLTFRMPAVRLLEGHAAASGAGTGFKYHFSWPSPVAGGILGACHALELPFVFGTHDVPGIDGFVGAEAPDALARSMMDAWIGFARDGDPGWDPYVTDGARPVRNFDVESQLHHNPRSERTAVWDGVL